MPPQPCRKRGSKKLTSLKHTSKYTNNKLIKILFEQGLVSLQCWSIDQILTTLTTYRNDPKLRTAYQWFWVFAYQTMMVDTEIYTGHWSGIFTRLDFDVIIRMRMQKEIEKWYTQKIQSFCKTASFGHLNDVHPGKIDQQLLENILKIAQERALLLTSIFMSVGPSFSFFSDNSTWSRLISVKIIIILIILCQSAHCNNSNYFLLFIALYICSTGAYADAIIFFDHLGISVLYNLMQKSLKRLLYLVRLEIKNKHQIAS